MAPKWLLSMVQVQIPEHQDESIQMTEVTHNVQRETISDQIELTPKLLHKRDKSYTLTLKFLIPVIRVAFRSAPSNPYVHPLRDRK